MNVAVYLFGEFNSGYSQYPEDYASSIFKTFYFNAKSITQIAIHREDDLMYYGYIRKLEDNRYIGLCVVLNGLYLTKIDGLFSLFENIVSNLIVKGKLIHFGEHGEIITDIERLYVNKEEIDLITESLRAGFNHLEGCMMKLPAVSYGRSKDSVENFTVDEDSADIVKSSYQNGYTFVYKSKGFNTAQLNSYKGVLVRISNENVNLKKMNNELQEQLQVIQRQKKQIKNIIFLTLIVIGCGIGLFLLNENLNNTQEKLLEANGTIKFRDIEIQNKNDRIIFLHDSLDSLQQIYDNEHRFRQKIEKELNNISQSVSFVVTNCDVNSTEFSFDYYAIEQGEFTVELKAINEKDSEIISNIHTLMFHKGNGSKKLKFYSRLDFSNYYYVVLICNGKIIAGERW